MQARVPHVLADARWTRRRARSRALQIHAARLVAAGVAALATTGCAKDDPDVERPCINGLFFVDCPGPSAPKVFCSKERCAWISTGRPTGPFTSSYDPKRCKCIGTACPPSDHDAYLWHWGAKPWTRGRALRVDVRYDRSPRVAKTQASCTNCTGGGACLTAPNTKRWMPGTFVQHIERPCCSWDGGWLLFLEADVRHDPPRARVCYRWYSDVTGCTRGNASYTCARSGQLTLSHRPDSGNLAAIAGSFAVTFTDGRHATGTLGPDPNAGKWTHAKETSCSF